MKFAYKVRSRQIENAPAWFDEQRFDIAAEPDVEGQPNEDQYRLMLRKLLTDRFQLKMHSVQKVFPVYALTVEKATSKLTRSEPGGLEHAHIVTKELADTEMLAQFLDATMFEFADILMNFIPERQIVDETGLKGRFDFPVTLPLSAVQGTGDPDEKVTAFFGALQPLGLRLVPKKESIEVFVIERLEKPSAN
jgi:uncharacterized protein (TIGR03435 family)